MKAIILLVFFLSANLSHAQDKDRLPQKLGTNAKTQKASSYNYKQEFLRSMSIEDSAIGYLYLKKGDTVQTLLRFSRTAMIEKMQSFIYAEWGSDSSKIFSPDELNGYSVLIPNDTMHFTSLENELEISSVLTRASPFSKQKMIGGSKKIFLNCLVSGTCKLYKYRGAIAIYSTNSNPSDDYSAQKHTYLPRNNLTGSDPASSNDFFFSTGNKYCCKKGDSKLIPLTKNNLAEVFHDSYETQKFLTKETLKDETALKTVFLLYNFWKEQAASIPTRY